MNLWLLNYCCAKFRVSTFSNMKDAIVKVTVRRLKVSSEDDTYQKLRRPHAAFQANWVKLRRCQKRKLRTWIGLGCAEIFSRACFSNYDSLNSVSPILNQSIFSLFWWREMRQYWVWSDSTLQITMCWECGCSNATANMRLWKAGRCFSIRKRKRKSSAFPFLSASLLSF